MPEERQDEASALHEHLLLLGQCVGKHGVLVPVHHTGGSLQSRLLNIFGVFGNGRDHAGDVLLPPHDYKLQLAQVIVCRSLERRRQDPSQYFVRHFPVGKVADGSPFLQYLIEIHNNTFLGYTCRLQLQSYASLLLCICGIVLYICRRFAGTLIYMP